MRRVQRTTTAKGKECRHIVLPLTSTIHERSPWQPAMNALEPTPWLGSVRLRALGADLCGAASAETSILGNISILCYERSPWQSVWEVPGAALALL